MSHSHSPRSPKDHSLPRRGREPAEASGSLSSSGEGEFRHPQPRQSPLDVVIDGLHTAALFDLCLPPCDNLGPRVVRAPRRLIAAPAARTGLPLATLDRCRRYPKSPEAVHAVCKTRSVSDVVVRGAITFWAATAMDLFWFAHAASLP